MKRSRVSRVGMLALSFALVFSLGSPTWLFASEAPSDARNTYITSDDIGSAVCPTGTFGVSVIAEHDTNANHTRVIEIKYPTTLGTPNVVQSKASQDITFDRNDDQFPEWNVVSGFPQVGGDYSILRVRTNETVSSSRPFWRLTFEFDMAETNVDAAGISASPSGR